MNEPIAWEGDVLGIQPRIRLLGSLDERSHSHLRHVLCVRATMAGGARDYTINRAFLELGIALSRRSRSDPA